jgi:hypothetical protein
VSKGGGLAEGGRGGGKGEVGGRRVNLSPPGTWNCFITAVSVAKVETRTRTRMRT